MKIQLTKITRIGKIFFLIFLYFFYTNNGFAKTIRFAEFAPNRGLRAEALHNFAETLKQRSGGSLKIQFFWGGSLLKTKSILQGVGDGVADMGSVVGFLTPKELSLYTIGDLPLNSDEWVGMRAMYELAESKLLKKEFQRAGISYISNYTTGPVQLICKKPLNNITNLQGKKIRASGAYAKVFATLGANIQKLSQPNVYQALQTGLVDCNQNYYYSIVAYKQYEAASYLTELDWGQNMSFGIIINQDFFQKLSNKEQKIIKELGREFIDTFSQTMIVDKDSIKAQLQKGIDGYQLQVSTLDKKQKAILLQKGEEQIANWLQNNNSDGARLLKKYQQLIKKYQKIKKNQGYPWNR